MTSKIKLMTRKIYPMTSKTNLMTSKIKLMTRKLVIGHEKFTGHGLEESRYLKFSLTLHVYETFKR